MMTDLEILKISGIGRFRSNSRGNHKTLNKTFCYEPKLNFNNKNNTTLYNETNIENSFINSDVNKHSKTLWDTTTGNTLTPNN
ncbi:uncharacterized protein TA15170 [Theileria annulata]|uniref:Uncharacterized protein n=1 Tax=Theileria annulata TaxID=5874 RepID=Q4UFC9_THEAN|nr:uncharacterized protein TA15170 [Theileria annulata]CAI74187.1 hypothetical protein TA15170 [Theileria annulata]|eukprot:XP_951919.1 hypothetical protein TA15170 [Theileria annulata]